MIVVVSLGFVAITAALLRSPFAIVPAAILAIVAVVETYVADLYKLFPSQWTKRGQDSA
jgi:hypothetical protein